MNQTRYCSTCGTLLSQGAAICGECGARYQESPYERRATDTPGAWSQAPRSRSRDLGREEPAQQQDEDAIQIISRESLNPTAPGATALRSSEQYDQMMVTQPPSNPSGIGSASQAPSTTGSHPVPGGDATSGRPSAPSQEMDPPLDGCVPASPLKRFLAALLDGVISMIVLVPLIIGLTLVLTQESASLLAQILIGVGAALPAAYTVLMIWLHGAKGFTLGKLIMGLRTTRFSQGGPIGLLRSLGRWFLYGAVSLIMALSIFLDPQKKLRGFHDRAVDSVVVDIKAGRNPLAPRPDDFERRSADHYLGDSSRAVTAHENLLATPGAAWAGADASASSAQQPQQGADQGGWGPGAVTESPYAPPASEPADAPLGGSPWSTSAPSAAEPAQASYGGPQDPGGAQAQVGGWAPPPEQSGGPPSATDPSAAQQEPQQWQQPAADPSQQQPHQQWQQPVADPSQQQGPPQQEPQQWQQPVADPSLQQRPPQQGPQQWQQPVAERSQQPPQQWQDPQPPTGSEHSGADHQVPGELTADAWDGGDIDEETRTAPPEISDLGDLEQTRVSVVAPKVKRVTLRADDGTERTVDRAVVIGRNPSATDGAVLWVLKDETRSMSKTHLRLDGSGEDVVVTDLGSTNGSAIVRADGSRESLVPDTPTVLPEGASLSLGDRSMSVERDS